MPINGFSKAAFELQVAILKLHANCRSLLENVHRFPEGYRKAFSSAEQSINTTARELGKFYRIWQRGKQNMLTKYKIN
jgi:hypothetical protein